MTFRITVKSRKCGRWLLRIKILTIIVKHTPISQSVSMCFIIIVSIPMLTSHVPHFLDFAVSCFDQGYSIAISVSLETEIIVKT